RRSSKPDDQVLPAGRTRQLLRPNDGNRLKETRSARIMAVVLRPDRYYAFRSGIAANRILPPVQTQGSLLRNNARANALGNFVLAPPFQRLDAVPTKDISKEIGRASCRERG